jgi:Glycosyl hydrolase family 36 N-terminal domain
MLSLSVRIKLTASGLIRLQATVRNEHPTERYGVGGLLLALPVPAVATELLDLARRHLRERSPQRRPFHMGQHGPRQPAGPDRGGRGNAPRGPTRTRRRTESSPAA